MDMLTNLRQENSNTIQMRLPMDLAIKIDINDPVVTFKEVMEGVN